MHCCTGLPTSVLYLWIWAEFGPVVAYQWLCWASLWMFVVCFDVDKNGDHIRYGGGIEEGAQSDPKYTQTSSVTKKGGKSLFVLEVMN